LIYITPEAQSFVKLEKEEDEDIYFITVDLTTAEAHDLYDR